jgi:uncharacterized membrane protein YedE/YeeE
MNQLAAFAAGALFALGLVLGDMTEPARIIHFLDVAGDWDATLLFVMGGAVLTYALLFQLIRWRVQSPLLAEQFHIPRRGEVDPKLLAGAALFGVGWGLAGLCPGPALVALGAGKLEAVIFVVAMVVGSYAAAGLDRLRQRQPRHVGQLAVDDA